MTAPTRRRDAVVDLSARSIEAALRAWGRAESIREEWLDLALADKPADRDRAEQSITRIYARLNRPRPTFRWVASPEAALAQVTGAVPTLDELYRWVYGPRPPGRPPLASDLAAGAARLRTRLDDAYERPSFDRKPPKRKKGEAWAGWPSLPPRESLEWGIPFREVLRRHFREHLRDRLPRLAGLGLGEPMRLPVCWYGRHDANWVGYYDALRRLDLAHYAPIDDSHLEDWVTLGRSSGWWWPGERECVVIDPGGL